MTDDNREVLRAGLAAINSGDIDRIIEFVHPEFEATVPAELSAEPDIYRGREGIRRYFETFWDAMEEIHFEAERSWEAGEHVVVSFRLTARGKQTGIPVEQRAVFVWTLRDRQALAVRAFASLPQALASVGLDERAPSKKGL